MPSAPMPAEEPRATPPGGACSQTGAALSGDLAAMSLFDIAQMLALSGRTGVLGVCRGDRRGEFFFQAGAIIAVVDDRGHEGMLAAVGILLWESGTFAFRACPVHVTRTIAERADAFLLEAARQVDEFREGHAATGGDERADLSEEASLVLKRRAMEHLRELFGRVTAESAPPASGGPAFELAVLHVEPGRLGVDAVYLRPGQRAVARQGRQLVPLWQESLAVDALQRWLRDVTPSHAAPGLEPGSDGCRFTIRAEDGCLVELAVFHEADQPACVARIVTPRIDPPEAIGLDARLLEPLLDRPRGLLVLAGPRNRALARSFGALTALVARHRGGLVVTLEKQRHYLLEQLDLTPNTGAVFQRQAGGPAEIASALDFARAEEADLIAADPLGPAVLGELSNAAWPFVVVGTVPGSGAVAGLRAVVRLRAAAVTGSADAVGDWLRRHLLGVVAMGHIPTAEGYRPAAELLVVSDPVVDAVRRGAEDELQHAFVAGRLPGSVSLAEFVRREQAA